MEEALLKLHIRQTKLLSVRLVKYYSHNSVHSSIMSDWTGLLFTIAMFMEITISSELNKIRIHSEVKLSKLVLSSHEQKKQ